MTTTREKLDKALAGHETSFSPYPLRMNEVCVLLANEIDDLRKSISVPRMLAYDPSAVVSVSLGTWVPESDVKRMMVATVGECAERLGAALLNHGTSGMSATIDELVADIGAGKFKP